MPTTFATGAPIDHVTEVMQPVLLPSVLLQRFSAEPDGKIGLSL